MHCLRIIEKLLTVTLNITVQPRYKAPHYSVVFIVTRPHHGSQNDYFPICQCK